MNIFAERKPYIIAGPCGIESEEQIQEIFGALQNHSVQMIRGGVWKPRSKPGYFEGKGKEALEWILKLNKKHQKKICIEVASKEQVEMALEYQIEAVWIGARTTVNPFLVQEIAESLRGNKIGVMVKNPVNPDIDLWSGAIERIQKVGIESVAAVHRGFSSYDNSSEYRNKPNWAIPIELKRRYKELPLFCDISHICGNRTLLQSVAQRALDLDFDGLMIEVHPNPDGALSDAKQQITPAQFYELLSHLKIRESSCNSVQNAVEMIRSILDTMDAEIIDLIGKRMDLVKELGKLKSENNIAIFQQDRWREIVISRTKWGSHNRLSDEFILKLFELIHDTSIKTQIEFSKGLND